MIIITKGSNLAKNWQKELACECCNSQLLVEAKDVLLCNIGDDITCDCPVCKMMMSAAKWETSLYDWLQDIAIENFRELKKRNHG